MRAADIQGVNGSAPPRVSPLRRRRGRVLSLMEALSADTRHESRWARRARSEERARRLERLLAGSGVRLLNDRRVPGARATVDHLAVGSHGVTVIDAVYETGRVRIVGGRLLIDGEDQTILVRNVMRQVEVIRLGLAASPSIPVNGAICWIEPDGLPRIRKLELGGILIDGPRAIAEELRRPGPVAPKRARQIAGVLDRRLPPRD
jgi:Nuclease-related domain